MTAKFIDKPNKDQVLAAYSKGNYPLHYTKSRPQEPKDQQKEGSQDAPDDIGNGSGGEP